MRQQDSTVQCIKCSGRTWLDIVDGHVYFHCYVCGTLTPQYVEIDGMKVSHSEIPDESSLPRKGSKLSLCFGTLHSLTRATTQRVAEYLDQSSSDTASQLTVLAAKGLVHRINEKRGVEGGSTWELTEYAVKIMGRGE